MPKINSNLLDLDSQSLETSGDTLQAKLTTGGNLKKTATGIDVDETKVELLTSKGVANGYCELDGSNFVPSSKIPSSALSSVTTVADIAARNALTPKESDVVIVTSAIADPVILTGGAAYSYDGTGWLLINQDPVSDTSSWTTIRADKQEIAPYYETVTTGVYSLPAGRYLIDEDVAFGTDRLELTDDLGFYVFRASNFNTITYTGTTPFIYNRATTTGTILDMKHFFITTASATAVEINDGNSFIANLVVFLSCQLAFNIDVCSFVTLNNCPFVACDDGCVLNDIDTINAVVLQFNAGTGTGTGITISGAASNRCSLTQVDSRPDTNEAFIDIQATYGGVVELVGGIHTAGAGVFFKVGSRDYSDVDVNVNSIKNVESSAVEVGAYVAEGDEASTTISTINTPVVIAGSWTIDSVERFSGDAAGKFTYTGKEDIKVHLSASLLVDPASGTNKEYNIYVRLNGTTLNLLSRDTVNADSATPAKAILLSVITLVENDYLEIVIENITDTTNVTAIATNCVIVGI